MKKRQVTATYFGQRRNVEKMAKYWAKELDVEYIK